MAKYNYYYDENKQLYRTKVDVYGVRKDITCKSKAGMEKKLDALYADLAANLRLDDKTTVAELAREWYRNRAHKWGYSRQADMQTAINNHICPFFGTMPVRDIVPEDFERFIAEKTELSYSSQHKLVGVLRNLFEMAVDNHIISSNPTKKLKAGGKHADEEIPLTKEQSKQLLEAVRDTRAYLFVMLILSTGLRRGEVFGLRWQDIDLESKHPSLTVNNQVTFVRNKGIFPSELKSPAAHRTIPIPDKLLAELKSEKAKSKSDFIIPAKGGSHISQQGARNISNIIANRYTDDPEKVGKPMSVKHPHALYVGFRAHPHQLRHTYITRLCESGMDIKKIQYLAGHASIELTLRVYAHVTNNAPKDLGGQVNKAVMWD